MQGHISGRISAKKTHLQNGILTTEKFTFLGPVPIIIESGTVPPQHRKGKRKVKEKMCALWRRMFARVPAEYAVDFKRDCLERNVRRFSILPFFNIITQLSCIFIYLYVYPTVYPERQQIDAQTYLLFTLVYCAVNVAAVIIFIWLRRPGRLGAHLRFASAASYLYVMAYVVLESSQVVIEYEISGNIYRFLATFFVVAFFPVVGRLARFIYMTAYIAISELAFLFLRMQGVEIYSYAEINVIIYVVCLIATYLFYNGTIKNYELRRRLEFLSMKDELTGLSNRRSMNQYLKQCWKITLRSGGYVGILMVDIDHFKNYNDTYGHQAGDECLAKVATAIQSCFVRETDLCARYGGEEFVVVLCPSAPGEAEQMAENVRAAIYELNIPHATNPPYERVTCSVGVDVQAPQPDKNAEWLLHNVDDALYAAKERGRNRVEKFEPPEPA